MLFQKQKGGLKRNVIESRVQSCLDSGACDIIDSSIDNYKWYDLRREELRKQNPDSFPPMLPLLKDWGPFPSSEIPVLYNWGHAHVYLVETAPNWTSAFNVLLSASQEEDDILADDVGQTDIARKGMRFLVSGNILEVMDNRTTDFYFLKARVQASMRDDIYYPTATIRNISGSVKNCTCSCKSPELGRCSHVAALLLFLTRHIEANGYKAMSCTDRPCTWGQGSVVRDPGNLKDKDYGDETHKLRAYFDPRPTALQKKTPQQLRDIRHNLLRGVQRLYVTEPQENDAEREYLFDLHLEYTYDPYEESKFTIKITILSCKMFLKEMRTTKNKKPFEEEKTKEQSKSKDWSIKRSLLFTASMAKRLCHITPQGYKNFLRDHLWLMNDFQGSSPTRYGLTKESVAIECYKSKKKETDLSVEVKTSGLWRNPKCMELGCSPDGLVTSKTAPTRLLEIKCPEMLKHGDPHFFEKYLSKSQQSRFCLYRSKNGKLKLKKDHAYMYQIQMSMGLLELKECDFVVWSPKDMFLQTIQFDRKMWEGMRSTLIPLHNRLLVPEYFLMRTPRNLEPCILKYDV